MASRLRLVSRSVPVYPGTPYRSRSPPRDTVSGVTGSSNRSLARDCRAALAELPAAWALTPVKEKRPYRPRWAEEAPVERELLAEEIERGHATGFALRTGPVSGGIFAIDEDGPGALAFLDPEPADLPRTTSCTSGRDGHRQRFFTVPEERWGALRNRTVFSRGFATPRSVKTSLRFGSMISCVPPARHPSGARYRWENGRGPEEAEPAAIPQELFEQAEYGPGEADTIVNAAWRGDEARVTEALGEVAADTADPDRYTALLRAVWEGHVGCTRILLAAGADPLQRDPLGRPALALASEVGQTDVMESLLAAGAEVDARDAAGRTSLHCSCWGGHAEAVEMLLAAGADPHGRDRDGREPADEAREWSYRGLAERLARAPS